MIIFWILTLFVGSSAFAFSYIYLQYDILSSLGFALVAMVLCRGILSMVRRSLILRERMAPEKDTLTRTVETNRAIFWRRALFVAALPIAYFVGAYYLFQLQPADALDALPGAIVSGMTNLLYILFLLAANFMLFLGPFYIYTRIGKTMINPDDANFGVNIEDVRGQKAAVNEMRKILDLIEHGRLFVKAGGKRERGVLMVGPPGTGKTMLAKGIAASLHVPIYIANGGSFAGMFMGIDALSVFLMVRAARKKAKVWGGCIVFIDEIDALGQRRSGTGGGAMGMMGGMMGGGQLGLNMLLVLMDGIDNPGMLPRQLRGFVNLTLDGLFLPRVIAFNGTRIPLRIKALKAPAYNILFIGATNRASVLDEALTRPGRFGRQIVFLMPKRDSRKDIAALYFDKKRHDPALDTPGRREEFARITEGYSPADIEQVLSLALLYAFNDGRESFDWKDVREAMGNVEAGLALPTEYSERDKIRIARHELGHAIASQFFKKDHGHIRLSVRRRADPHLGEIGGYHLALPTEEQYSKFRSQFAADIRHSLGAIACERVFYGENTAGVSEDLRMATAAACQMVGIIGMGADDLEPQLSAKAANIGEQLMSVAEIPKGAHEQSTWEGAVLSNPRARRMVAQILGSAYIDDWRLMYVNKDAIDLAAEALLNQGGELMGDEISGLLESVGLRAPEASDPYPEELPSVPERPIAIAGSA
ncbi:MAG: cell division protease FtsH [Chloroflexota bacterium]|nr:cell division protease FtsH [Chloroflexota bacterium]